MTAAAGELGGDLGCTEEEGLGGGRIGEVEMVKVCQVWPAPRGTRSAHNPAISHNKTRQYKESYIRHKIFCPSSVSQRKQPFLKWD